MFTLASVLHLTIYLIIALSGLNSSLQNVTDNPQVRIVGSVIEYNLDSTPGTPQPSGTPTPSQTVNATPSITPTQASSTPSTVATQSPTVTPTATARPTQANTPTQPTDIEFSGTIKGITNEKLTLDTDKGVLEFQMPESGKIQKDGKSSKLEDIKVGDKATLKQNNSGDITYFMAASPSFSPTSSPTLKFFLPICGLSLVLLGYLIYWLRSNRR